MLLSAQCGPSGFTAIADDGQRFRGSYIRPAPVDDDGCPVDPHPASTVDAAQPKSSDAVVRLRPNSRLERLGDSRFDPAAMSDAERAAMLDAEIQNDSQPVMIAMRLFHRLGWRIRDVLDDNSNPVPKVAPYVAYSRLPVVGESDGYVMPLPVVLDSDRDDTGVRFCAACGQYTHPARIAKQPLVSREEAAELLIAALADFVTDLERVNRLAVLAECGS